jgi:uncharacterized protein (TIGR03086 family)
MEPIEQLSHILPTLSATVARIQAGQLNDPTPCDKFTVHDVLDHMIVGGGTFAYLFRGEEPPELTAPKVDGRVPVIEFGTVMKDLLDAVRTPGAMERIVSTPVGQMPGAAFAGFVAFDGLVHGWDLARATGLDFELSPDVIASGCVTGIRSRKRPPLPRTPGRWNISRRSVAVPFEELPFGSQDAVQEVIVVHPVSKFGGSNATLHRHSDLGQRTLLGHVVDGGVGLHPV